MPYFYDSLPGISGSPRNAVRNMPRMGTDFSAKSTAEFSPGNYTLLSASFLQKTDRFPCLLSGFPGAPSAKYTYLQSGMTMRTHLMICNRQNAADVSGPDNPYPSLLTDCFGRLWTSPELHHQTPGIFFPRGGIAGDFGISVHPGF